MRSGRGVLSTSVGKRREYNMTISQVENTHALCNNATPFSSHTCKAIFNICCKIKQKHAGYCVHSYLSLEWLITVSFNQADTVQESNNEDIIYDDAKQRWINHYQNQVEQMPYIFP